MTPLTRALLLLALLMLVLPAPLKASCCVLPTASTATGSPCHGDDDVDPDQAASMPQAGSCGEHCCACGAPAVVPAVPALLPLVPASAPAFRVVVLVPRPKPPPLRPPIG